MDMKNLFFLKNPPEMAMKTTKPDSVILLLNNVQGCVNNVGQIYQSVFV